MLKSNKTILLVILVLINFSVYSLELMEMETINVTAEKSEVKEKETARLVNVSDVIQLEKTAAVNVIDSLRRIGGFQYKQLGPNGLNRGGMHSRIHIRGVEKGEKVLINGMSFQNISTYSYDLNMISPDNIERVEVIKGAASALYGADAMSGVINIITKKNSEKLKTKLRIFGGNEDYKSGALSVQSKYLNLGFNYNHFGKVKEFYNNWSSKGYHYSSDDADKYSMDISVFPTKNLTINFLGSKSDYTFSKIYNSNYTSRYKEWQPGIEKGLYEDRDQSHKKYVIDFKYKIKNFTLKGSHYNDYIKTDYLYYKDLTTATRKKKNKHIGAELDYNFKITDINFITGIDYYAIKGYNSITSEIGYDWRKRNDYSIFIQGNGNITKKLRWVLGFREQLIKNEGSAEDYNQFLPSLGLTYKQNKNLNFFMNSNTSFMVPSFSKLYATYEDYVGNPDLKPEKGWTNDIGLKYNNKYTSIRLAVFFMKYDDKIEGLDIGDTDLWTYISTKYESNGFEWSITLNPFVNKENKLSNFYFDLNGYFANPKIEKQEDEETGNNSTEWNMIQAGAKVQFSTSINYKDENFLCTLSSYHLYKRENKLRDSVMFNLYSKYNCNKNLALIASVDNIFDRKNDATGDRREDGQNATKDSPRLFRIGAEYSF